MAIGQPQIYLRTTSLVLAVLALIELAWFVDVHWERWQRALPARGQSATRSGAGLVIRSDGLGYYAWLRSLLIDADVSFDNEFDEHNPLGDFVPPPEDRTAVGLRSNPWSVGPACTWALTIVPVHAFLSLFQRPGFPWPTDGYSLPYQLAVGGTSLVGGFLTIGLIYCICRRWAASSRALFTTGCLVLGTTILHYSAIEPSMAHGLATMMLAGLVAFWQTTYGSTSYRRWAGLGFLVGGVALMRWQLVTVAWLPIGEALLFTKEARYRAWFGAGGRLACAGVAAGIALFPQLLAWKRVYGSWLATPIPVSHNWLSPSFGAVLWSTDRGWFYWTPLCLVAGMASLGALRLAKPGPQRAQLSIFFLAFVMQVYVLASLWGTGVYLGVSFGFRHLTESIVLLAPGLAFCLQRMTLCAYRRLGAILCLLVFWNLLLVALYRYGWIPADHGATLETLATQAGRLLLKKRWQLLASVALGPALLWIAAVGRPWRLRARDPQGIEVPAGSLASRPLAD